MDPFQLFSELFEEAKLAVPVDPNAMVLATADVRGRPSARVVLLKDFGPEGFVFYTNVTSRKGRELTENPFAALCFHWKPMEKQVRIEGRVERVSDREADAYFESRVRGSQVGAWASHQSEPLERRELLQAKVKEIEARFEGRTVPRPPFWSGFRVVPDQIEFWTNRRDRLHERLCFIREGAGAWSLQLLSP